MGELNPFAPPVHDEPRQDRVIAERGERFFLVSRTKFVVMCVATFGLYEFFWFYKHWKHIQNRTRASIVPILRAVFALFFTHSLLRAVRLAAAEADVEPSFQVQSSAWGFIILSLLYRLPDPYWLVAIFAFVPLLPVQHTINETHRRTAPTADPNAGYSLGNWVAIVVGLAVWTFVLLGLFVPEAVSQ